MNTTNTTTQCVYNLIPAPLVSKPLAQRSKNSGRQPARLASLAVLMLVMFASVVIPAATAQVTFSTMAGPWQGSLFVDGPDSQPQGCGLETMSIVFPSPGFSNGIGYGFSNDQSTGCGFYQDEDFLMFTGGSAYLATNGKGLAYLQIGVPEFQQHYLNIQVSPNSQVFNMVDVTDPGYYYEGTAIAQPSAPVAVSQLAGNWQASLVIDGGCGMGTKLVNFNLNVGGVGTAIAQYHTPACGNNQETGTIEVTSLNTDGMGNGSGTAQLIFGESTVFNFSIQVSPNGQVIDMVEGDSSSGNYEEGLAIRQAPVTSSQLLGNWQATLVIDGGCGLGTKLVNFNLNNINSGGFASGTATAHYNTPGCGENVQTGVIEVNPNQYGPGSGTAILIFGASEFIFQIQASANGQVMNLVDISGLGNYDEGSAIRQ
jgi:hypothetical protein